MNPSDKKATPTRRNFLKHSTLAAVGGAVATKLSLAPGAYAAGSDTIKVGLIGCGGRGTGAADNAIHSAQGVKLVAMADAFQDRLDRSLKTLQEKAGTGVEVPEESRFVGFDAYQKVIASDVDYIILATPPAFRPEHLKAAVAAGKNLFCEKPVAVDGSGIRSVLATYEEAKKKNLNIVVGTQRHHQAGYIETLKRVQDGAIGNILAARCYWNTGGLWMKPRQPDWSDMEWQLRNWLYFTWLSGDHIVEQHVHNLDVVNWAKEAHPVRAVGLGGRQQRTGPEYGHIFDHFAIDYEYADGMHLMSMCRQIPGCANSVSEALTGKKGFCQVNEYSITGMKNWKYAGDKINPYVQEHTDLIAGIRSGKTLNELKTLAESTLTAIMGRMSAYSGKAVTWEQAMNSGQKLGPEKLAWDHLPVPAVAIPGQTEFV